MPLSLVIHASMVASISLMRFLSLLRSRFASLARRRRRGVLSLPPGPREELSRYLLSRSQFSSMHQRVKYHAFLPEPRSMETSVFRVRGRGADEIWDLGQRFVARADITTREVLEVGLAIHPDNRPERHATIRGWPEEKERQMILATELAAASQLHVRLCPVSRCD